MKKLYEGEWYAELYDPWNMQHWGERDIPFWQELAQESGASVLELACGTGRISIPLARTGLQMMGLDLCESMLNIARRKLVKETAEVQARLQLLKGDMRNFSLNERFGLIFIPFRSFQALLTQGDQRACLECCAHHLKPEGRLGINVFNPRFSLIATPGGKDFDFGSTELPDGGSLRHTAHCDYDPFNQRLLGQMKYEISHPDGRTELREGQLELSFFFRNEMRWLLEACGFEVEATYGYFDRSPLQADSPEMIIVVKRRVT